MSQSVPLSQHPQLNNVSRVYHGRFEQANDIIFNSNKHSEAYDIYAELLGYLDLPIILQIKCHYMLAHPDNNFLAHAVEADRILKEVMKDRRPSVQLDELKVKVDAVLKQAHEDVKDPKWNQNTIGSGLDKDDEGKETENEEKKTENEEKKTEDA